MVVIVLQHSINCAQIKLHFSLTEPLLNGEIKSQKKTQPGQCANEWPNCAGPERVTTLQY